MSITNVKMMAVFLVAVCAVVTGGALPGQERKKADKDGTTMKGKLASVDGDKNSVTITIHTFNRATGEGTDTNKTFPLAKDAKILQDAAAAKLTELKKGFPTTLTLDGTNVTSVSVDGGTAQGDFRSANVERNTITVLAGRDLSRHVYHLLKDTSVIAADGKPTRIQDLKPGTKVLMTRSVEDGNTVIRVQALPESGKKEQ